MKTTQASTLTVISVAVALAVMPGLVFAKPDAAFAKNAEQDKAVAIGMGSGAAFGAVVAGPIGAAVGGILGAMMGNDTVQKQLIEEKNQALTAKEQALSATQRELFAMRDALQTNEQEATATTVVYTQDRTEEVMAVESNIQFKTGSTTVEAAYARQLDLIAQALKLHPTLQVRLIGHADNRGDSQFNQALSMQRALQVQAYLLNQGVSDGQVQTVAMGEAQSLGDSVESAFFDRKVVMQVADIANEAPALTASR